MKHSYIETLKTQYAAAMWCLFLSNNIGTLVISGRFADWFLGIRKTLRCWSIWLMVQWSGLPSYGTVEWSDSFCLSFCECHPRKSNMAKMENPPFCQEIHQLIHDGSSVVMLSFRGIPGIPFPFEKQFCVCVSWFEKGNAGLFASHLGNVHILKPGNDMLKIPRFAPWWRRMSLSKELWLSVFWEKTC